MLTSKLKKIIIFLTLGLSSNLSAQNIEYTPCVPAKTQDYKALVISSALDHIPLIQKITTTYCMSLDNFDFKRISQPHPIFYSTRPAILNYYIQSSRNFISLKQINTNFDILSHILTYPYGLYENMDIKEKNQMLQTLYPYDNSVSPELFNNPLQVVDNYKDKYNNPLVWNNYKEMINTAAHYYENLLTLPEDKHGNNVMFYSVLVNQPAPLEKTLVMPYHNLYRTNKDGYTVFHLAFAGKLFHGSEEEFQHNRQILSSILIEQFKPERTNFLDLPDITFNEFLELMKENNLDLYNLIIQKQKSIGIEFEDLSVQHLVETGLFEHHNNVMQGYVTNIQ